MEFFNDVGGTDPLRPSLFEVIAQEQLRDLLQPALKYVLAVRALPHYFTLPVDHVGALRCLHSGILDICFE